MRYIVKLVATNKNTGAKLETKLVLGEYIESAGGYLVQSMATHLTPRAPDAGDSAASSELNQASALSTSQAESAPTQRG